MGTQFQNAVLDNYQTTLNGSVVQAVPFLDGFEKKSAQFVSGRNQGGSAYLQPPWIVNAKGIIAIDDIIVGFDTDGLAKHGWFHVTLSGTTAVNIDLTNLTTGATSYYGDTTFATWNKLVLFNLTGLDGVAAAAMTFAQGGSNPAPLGFTGTTPALSIPASSPIVLMNKAGGTISGTAKIVTVTPSAGGNFVLGVAGA